MKNFLIALATIAALASGTFSTAEARSRGVGDGAHKHRHGPVHRGASSHKFQHALDQRQAMQRARIRHGWYAGSLNHREVSRLNRDQKRIANLERRFGADGRYTRHERRVLKGALGHSSKRIWRMKHNHYGWKHGLGRLWWHHKRFDRRHWWPHRLDGHIHRVRPVYKVSPGHGRGVEVETEEFRFKVYGSG